MKKYIGDLELIDNGIAHISNNEELKILITSDLILRFTFVNDDNDKSHRIDKKLINEKDLAILCINFDNPLGEGVLSPVRLGTLGGKDFYITMFVWNTNTDIGLRVLSYNIYQRN